MTSHTTDPSGNPTSVGTAPALVTLWEEYGAGAEVIGRAVTEKLGLPDHQQALSSEELEGEDRGEGENTPPPDDGATAQAIAQRISLAQVFSAMGGAYAGGDGAEYLAAARDRRALSEENNATVRGYGDEGGVIVGRNATKILANRPHTLHVLLTADAANRVAHAVQHAGISTQQAQKRQRHEDTVRSGSEHPERADGAKASPERGRAQSAGMTQRCGPSTSSTNASTSSSTSSRFVSLKISCCAPG